MFDELFAQTVAIFWVLLVSGRLKTIIPEAGSTFLPFQHAARG